MNRIIKYLLIYVAVVMCFGFNQNYDTNAKIKAVFIYNFTRYFEWPGSKKTGNFVIHIVGNNPNLLKELGDVATKKTVGNQKIEVKSLATFDPKSPPHMLFILADNSKILTDAIKKYSGKGTLIISEKEGAAKGGAAINFVVIDNKQKFEYSKNNAVKAGLKTSEDFKSLAIAID